MTKTAYINAHLIDPAHKLDQKGALLVENGKIVDIGANIKIDGTPTAMLRARTPNVVNPARPPFCL